MGRRRNEGLPDILHEVFLVLPWWVGPPVAGATYIGMKLSGAAFSKAESPLGMALGGLLSPLAPFAALLVVVVWIAALAGKVRRRHLLATREGIESIRSLGWRDFELLVGEALRRQGYTVVETGGGGADGGIDLIARRADEKLVVQCKRWKTWTVGVNVVREMFGVMTAERATGVLIVTTGQFTRSAEQFADGKPIRLMDGAALVELLENVKKPGGGDPGVETDAATVQPAKQPEQVSGAKQQESPSECPKCGSPMLVRVAKKGPNAGARFLGCSRYPACTGTRDLPPA